MSYDSREHLRQALLELHYDLLEEAEADSLRRAIETDPDVASEWASIQELAEQIADAASLQQFELPAVVFSASESAAVPTDSVTAEPGIVLRRPGDHGESSVSERGDRQERDSLRGNQDQSVQVAPVAVSHAWSWATSASVAVMAAMLGMLLLGSWYFARIPQAPAAVIRLQARQVPRHLAKSDHEFRVFTSRIDRASPAGRFPVTPASLSFSVLARERVLFSGEARTDKQGATSIVLPEELVIPPDATLQVTAESTRDAARSSSIELPLEPTRCVTYLTLDRPIYRPGETVYFRSLTLQRRSLKARSEFPIRFELLGPVGEMLPEAFLEGVTERGVGNGSFAIPNNAVAGSYTLLAKSLDGFFPEQRYEFQVHAYRVPRFKKALRFLHPRYAPGETVEAEFTASLVSGAPLALAPVQVVAKVGDQVIHQSQSRTTSSGTCDVTFPLPKQLEPVGVQLLVTVEDQGTRETEVAAVPLRSGQLEVHFYPEGGYLVDGIENRVYFTAQDGLGAPVHLEGELVDDAGHRLADVATTRDGMGRFSFRPAMGQSYRLRVDRPADASVDALLPEVANDLPVMETGSGVFAAGASISMTLRVERARSVLVRMSCRGQLVGERRFSLQPGGNPIELLPSPDADGVLCVTVLDSQTKPARPLVERLVYRRPQRRLHVEVLEEPNVFKRSPGESLSLELQVRDEQGDPIAAVLGVSVVDDHVWSLDQQDRPSLDTQFLLLSEVERPEQLEHADFYLSDDADAETSLDLLLGTQGWRRFVRPEAAESLVDFREQLIRLLDLDGHPVSASPRFDNASVVASEWFRYQQAADQSWQRLLVEVRVLAFLVFFLWFAAFLIFRRVAKAKFASCLLLGSSSLLMYGCGGSHDAMVVDAPASVATAASDEAAAPGPRVRSTSPRPLPVANDGAVGASNRGPDGDVRMASASEIPPQLVDWLDEAKATWLLRISQQAGGASVDAPSAKQAPITSEELGQLMASRGWDAAGLADELLLELQFPIRQYAHRRPANASERQRDLAETLYWHPLLLTDEQGRVTIQFDLPDTATAFRIRMDGHTNEGRIGSGEATIVTSE